MGRLERRLGVLAGKQGDLATAGDYLRRARERFEAAGRADEMGRVLDAQGQLDAPPGRDTAPAPPFREAPAWAQPGPRAPRGSEEHTPELQSQSNIRWPPLL